jgi:hypothetical protein
MHHSNFLNNDTNTSPENVHCRLFKRDITGLYMLSLMLTADVDSAESCLVSSLGDCMSMKPTLSEWTNGWTRRVLVQNAIELMRPSVDSDEQSVTCNLKLKPALRALMQLKNFERFVFVLSVLEGYSGRECSLLLRSSAREVMAAKVRALENLAANFKVLAPPSSSGVGKAQLTNPLRVPRLSSGNDQSQPRIIGQRPAIKIRGLRRKRGPKLSTRRASWK